jgi:hypothetical protein
MKEVKKTRLTAAGFAGVFALAMFASITSGAVGATYISFDVPDGISTEPRSINDHGDVTGTYFPSAGGFTSGFIRASDGTFTTFVVNSSDTGPTSINRAGEVVGSWEDRWGIHGFLRKPSGEIVLIVFPGLDDRDLNYENQLRINDSGKIGGQYATRGFIREPNG